MGLAGAVALAVSTVAISNLMMPSAQAEDTGTEAEAPVPRVVPPGQIILNPEPDRAASSAAQQASEALAALEPAAGAAGPACPEKDGWQVVVVRGNARAETVRGRLIAVTPQGC